jgi:putative NADPH-quinone reductase
VNVLVVCCHPLDVSFTAAIASRAVDTLRAAGHEVRVNDLYAEGFAPEITAAELRGEPPVDPTVRRHAADLRWCRAVVFVHPTWWSSQPAMLTGWIQRLLAGGARYRNVRRIVIATSHGSSKWVNMVQGEGGKRVWRRTFRARCHRLCRSRWIALYGIDRASAADRAAHLARVERALSRLG